MWLKYALMHIPLNRGKYSNIRRMYINGFVQPAHTECSRCEEIEPEMQGTEILTWELLKRMGRVKASAEHLPFHVSVKFADGNNYTGLFTVIKAKPDTDDIHVAKIEFDDGDTEFYTQRDLYMEVAGN